MITSSWMQHSGVGRETCHRNGLHEAMGFNNKTVKATSYLFWFHSLQSIVHLFLIHILLDYLLLVFWDKQLIFTHVMAVMSGGVHSMKEICTIIYLGHKQCNQWHENKMSVEKMKAVTYHTSLWKCSVMELYQLTSLGNGILVFDLLQNLPLSLLSPETDKSILNTSGEPPPRCSVAIALRTQANLILATKQLHTDKHSSLVGW